MLEWNAVVNLIASKMVAFSTSVPKPDSSTYQWLGWLIPYSLRENVHGTIYLPKDSLYCNVLLLVLTNPSSRHRSHNPSRLAMHTLSPSSERRECARRRVCPLEPFSESNLCIVRTGMKKWWALCEMRGWRSSIQLPRKKNIGCLHRPVPLFSLGESHLFFMCTYRCCCTISCSQWALLSF